MSRWGQLAAICLAITTSGCDEKKYVVPHDTLACMKTEDYSVLLQAAGGVSRLNAQAARYAATNPLCDVLHKGEVVTVQLGIPGQEAVMIEREAKMTDPSVPSYMRGMRLSYWANF